MGKKTEGQGKIIKTVDCTPDWVPIVTHAVQWIKDAKQFEKQYRKDCTDYDGAMEAFTATIIDCARGLDKMNKQTKEVA